MNYKYGYFENDEFVITNPKTPRAFDNFLWNDAIFSNVQQTGVGYCDYQVGENEAIQLLTGVGRICDFDVFGRDHLMSRLIYIRDNQTGEYWNVNWEPVRAACDKYECRHGLGYTVINTVKNGVCCEFRIFVPQGDDPVELWTLKIYDIKGKKRNLSVFVYNQMQFKYKWGFDSYGDMIFRAVRFNKELNAIVATKHPHIKPHDYLTGFIASDEPIAAFDGTRNAFVGLYNTLSDPMAVINGCCTNSEGSADATITAAQYNIELQEDEHKEINIILGATNNEAGIKALNDKYLGSFEQYFNELVNAKKVMREQNLVKTPDEHFNRMLNSWIKQSTLYGATWCRWGWNGYRDIVQHGFGVVTFEPERTKKILIEAFKHQYKAGPAIRGWNPIDEKPYSDSALWLVFTFVAYLKETGDLEFLEETVDYYDGGKATVIEHIEGALNFIEKNKGEHDLCLIKYGDWNDSLTAVGKEGKGESVWLSEAYAQAMLDMQELYAFLGDTQKQNSYKARYDSIKDAVNKSAWDGKWYKRCFADNGDEIGASTNDQAKIFVESQAWALISQIADKERAEQTLKSCDELLLQDSGYALLYPTFNAPDSRVGRISCMEPGIAENGTIYSHTNIWMILGMLKYDMPDKAYELYKKITPGYIAGEHDQKHDCPPYMYANCYFGNDHRNSKGQMEFTWVTGSVAWFNNVLLQYMLGAKAEYEGLRIAPNLPSEWDECEVSRSFRGCVYNIKIKRTGENKIFADGKEINNNILPAYNDGQVHNIEAFI